MNPPSTSLRPPPGYAVRGDRFDECLDPQGGLRAPWAEFLARLGPDPVAALRNATAATHRAIIEQDVSMNVYRGEQAGAQLWPLDPLPMLVSAADWAKLTRGLRQRAHVFNELLRDLYGEQRHLREGRLPAHLAMANPHFLRACHGLGQEGAPFLHTYAADLARSPDGQWWVIEDRLDAPSGLGYSLQNRIIARQALPQVFHHAPVERLFEFFRTYRTSLAALSPHPGEARIALLTPGSANESYHEQAYLARYLGYTLVEGEDLTTRDHQVFLRTIGGLLRTDVVVRRLDSEYIDPLELESRSLLGVPGLLHAAQRGQLGLANLPGARALETPALLAFLQPLCAQILGEDLLLPHAATWWCGQEGPADYVLENLERLVVKPTFRAPEAEPPRYGAWLTPSARAALADRIRAQPAAWCGQERVFHGTTPGWHRDAFRPVPFITRVYLAWHDGDYVAMPGGLTRCNPDGQDMIVSLQRGSVSKDTWVLHDGPAAAAPALLSAHPTEALRHPEATPSRAANNLFWLGRYLERAGVLASGLEKLESLLLDEITAVDPTVPADALRLLFHLQDSALPAGASLDAQAAAARRIAVDPAHYASLTATLGHIVRLLDTLKARLPHEAWQLTRHLRQRRKAGDTVACAWVRQNLSSLQSLTSENMPHDAGWRFLELGRRLERGTQLVTLLQHLLPATESAPPTEFRLQTLLHLADALFTYRHAYHGAVDTVAALEWLLVSPQNPRSLRFQIEQTNQHLAQLPTELAPRAVAALCTLAFKMLSDVRLADSARLAHELGDARRLLADLQGHFGRVSEELHRIYFSHAENR